jgi:hypothetical protein
MNVNSIKKTLAGADPTGDHPHSQIHVSSPDAFLKVYAYTDQDTTRASATDNVQVFTIYNDILSIDTSKNKQSAGSWNVTLAPGQAYNTMVHPGDWITIHVSDEKLDPEKDALKSIKLIGIVKTVRRVESANPETGIRNIRYIIAGEDFASCLNIPLYINSELAGTSMGTGELALVSLLHGSDPNANNRVDGPAGLANQFLNLVFNGGPNKDAPAVIGFQFRVPKELIKDTKGTFLGPKGGSGFLNLAARDFQKNLIGKSAVHPDLGGTITVLSLLQTYSNTILNEFFADIFPDGKSSANPTLVLRSLPFSRLSKNPQSLSITKGDKDNKGGDKPGPQSGDHKLYVSRNISESEIIQLNFGKSDAERFNFFLAVPNAVTPEVGKNSYVSMIQNTKGGLKGLSDMKSLIRYGIRPYIASSIFLLERQDAFKEFNYMVRDMWSRAALYDNGVVELVGASQHIPVGTNIKFTERKWIAHVEAVTNNYKVDPSTGLKTFKTTVAFVRLQDLAGDPLFLRKGEAQTEHDPGITTGSGALEEDKLYFDKVDVKIPGSGIPGLDDDYDGPVVS